jgi:prepilin-type N-terminal cleavage/methylation domain-containing protein
MKKSFTLIELLVVCGIFGIFALGTFNFFISQVTLQTQTLMLQQAFNELSFAIDKMSKEIRMAKKDDIEYKRVSKDCSGNPTDKLNFWVITNGIGFRDYLNRCHKFFLQNNQIMEEALPDIPVLPLTSNSTLVVQNLKFKLIGETQNDTKQPKVTILIEAKIRGKYEIPIKVQTTVSQADLDIQY